MEITNNNVLPKHTAQTRGRLTGIFLVITFAAPMLIAYWIYHTGMGIPDATVNKGTLLFPATDISSLMAKDSQGNTAAVADKSSKLWRMIIPIDNQCDEACAENIYTTRQVHKRLAKESHRIERFLLQINDSHIDLDPGFIRTLEIEDPGLAIAQVNQSLWMNLFSDTNALNSSKTPSIILVDQEGFAMMIYNQDHSGNDLLTDLSRLLKYSYE
ncbi:hypothetical protein [Sessilibacter corallicola]|uniref:Cytochrome c oxidase subunit I n=1 Tax=Sessilibacter corallicola TaxID=2904075 RepID=A0ABQ0ABB7_9GAMM|nr:hypothetical protein [Sessilibacter corallicola]MCE2028066.1 hypothetical protein [Sessilibacter corallicola]